MEIAIFQVDAFCKELFSGNPAAVCPLISWLSDELMQQIAAGNNLSETAFYVPEAAHIIYNHKGFAGDTVRFFSRSGELMVKKAGNLLTLDFPVDTLTQIPVTDDMSR